MDSDWTRPMWDGTGMISGLRGYSEILGLYMSQNGYVVPWLSEMARLGRPRTIVELGTAGGGLTYLLGGMGDWVCSFDLAESTQASRYAGRPEIRYPANVDLHHADIFEGRFAERDGPIGSRIQEPGLTWLLCDNGDKNRELEMFAVFLKPGDIIAVHEYCPRRDTWNWHEVDEQRAEAVAREHGLEVIPELQYDRKAAWWVRRKA